MTYPRHKLLGIAFLMEGGALLAALILARYLNIELFPLTDNAFQDILIGTAGALPPFILFLCVLSKKTIHIPFFGSLRKTMLSEVKEIFSCTKLSDLVLISLIAGFAEEMLFRGVLQVKYGIVTASIIFGLIHCVSPAYVIVTILMGFYIGALFFLCGNVLVPIQLHFIYDLAALVYLRYFVNPQDT